MLALAALCCLAAACCLYLAAPNQLLLPPPASPAAARRRHRAGLVLGTLLALLGLALWRQALGWPAAVSATLVAVPCSLSLYPFFGAYAFSRRQHGLPARRAHAGGRA